MKQKIKRLSSIILVLAIILSCQLPVFAEDAQNVEETVQIINETSEVSDETVEDTEGASSEETTVEESESATVVLDGIEKAEDKTILYVALDGSDSNAGTINAPLASIEGARDKIRALKASNALGEGGAVVYVPVEAKEGDCILLCSLFYKQANEDKFETIEKELNKRGIKTVNLKKPSHKQIADALEKEKPVCVIVNSCVSQLDSIGSSLRLGWDEVFAFWRGYIFRHPKVIFTSFADPYKLYELPFLRTYVNTFSYTEESQKAFVKILLGEIEAKGKNPVELEGFFEREV